MQCGVENSGSSQLPDDESRTIGSVQQACRKWAVLEDGILANKLQEQEIQSHYGNNKFRNHLVRTDIQEAKSLQTAEKSKAEVIKMNYEKILKEIADADEQMALQLQDKMLEEESHKQQLKEKEDEYVAKQLYMKEKQKYEQRKRASQLIKEKKQVDKLRMEKGLDPVLSEALQRLQLLSNENEDLDFSDFFLEAPHGLTEVEKKRFIEQQDAELAKLIQDQETKRGGHVNKDCQFAIEEQDRELAKALQEHERARAKKLKEKAKQRALQKQMEKDGDFPSNLSVISDDRMSQNSDGQQRYSSDEASSPVPRVPNIAIALDPTYNRRKGFAESQTSSSPYNTWQNDTGPSTLPDVPATSYYEDDGSESPVPPYMLVQSQKRSPVAEKGKKGKKHKEGCKQQ